METLIWITLGVILLVSLAIIGLTIYNTKELKKSQQNLDVKIQTAVDNFAAETMVAPFAPLPSLPEEISGVKRIDAKKALPEDLAENFESKIAKDNLAKEEAELETAHPTVTKEIFSNIPIYHLETLKEAGDGLLDDMVKHGITPEDNIYKNLQSAIFSTNIALSKAKELKADPHNELHDFKTVLIEIDPNYVELKEIQFNELGSILINLAEIEPVFLVTENNSRVQILDTPANIDDDVEKLVIYTELGKLFVKSEDKALIQIGETPSYEMSKEELLTILDFFNFDDHEVIEKLPSEKLILNPVA